MSKMVSQLSLSLLKLQSTFGTAETTLAAADLVETVGPTEFTWSPNVESIDLVAGSFDQDAAVPGNSSYEVALKSYVNTGNGSGSYGQIDTLLQTCCMAGTTSAGPKKTYAFTSTRSAYKDATVWGYSGDLSSSGALLRKASNIIMAPKFMLESGKPAVLELSGSGVYGGAAIAATQPAITKARVSPPALLGATVTINGSAAYKLLKADIDCGQEVNLTLDPSKAYGHGNSAITNRKIKWTATVYCDVPGTVDPEAALLARTEGAVSFVWGTAPNKVTISMTYGQITVVNVSDQDGVQTWELEGQANRNTFAVELDTTV